MSAIAIIALNCNFSFVLVLEYSVIVKELDQECNHDDDDFSPVAALGLKIKQNR